jgi:hypothetical protein
MTAPDRPNSPQLSAAAGGVPIQIALSGDARILRPGLFLPTPREHQMTEPMIEEIETETEEFTDELSDEALDRLDREGAKLSSAGTMPSR